MDINALERVKSMALCMQRRSWEQGCLAQAFLELGDERTTILLAKEAQLQQGDDGRVGMTVDSPVVTDPCSMGEALLFAYGKTKDECFKKSYEKLLNWALYVAPRNQSGLLYHITNKAEIWADSFYMLPPFLAALGEYDESIKQLDGYWETLFIESGGLLSHKWDCETQEYSRGALWGEGNGWAISGMARVIALLPNDYSNQKKRLIFRSKLLIDSALKYIRNDCFFHDVVNDSDTCIENGFSQLLAYGIYRGVADEWLDKSYISYADKIYEAVNNKVNEYGLVMDVCSASTNFIVPGPNAEGQAFYMLMCAAKMKYNRIFKDEA